MGIQTTCICRREVGVEQLNEASNNICSAADNSIWPLEKQGMTKRSDVGSKVMAEIVDYVKYSQVWDVFGVLDICRCRLELYPPIGRTVKSPRFLFSGKPLWSMLREENAIGVWVWRNF
jgi:hypothetical protein